MTTPDPLARLRDAFTLEEAARVICEVPLSRDYPRRTVDWTQELRDERARVDVCRRQLEKNASALGVTVTHHPEKQDIRPDRFTRDDYVARTIPEHDEFGEVTRAALVDWCEAKRLRPAALFGKPIAAHSEQIGELKTRERETLLGLIGVLCEAAGIDLTIETKGHAEAARIVFWAASRGVKTSKETIAAKITAARELISPKGPVQHDTGAGSRSNSNRGKSS